MRNLFLVVLAVFGLTFPGAAQDPDQQDRHTVFGGDRYLAGRSVLASDPTEGDLFAAGERVSISAPVGQSAHIAGRRLRVDASIGGALYAAGYEVRVDAPVAGAASLAGAEVLISEQIGGNLRATGSEVMVEAPVMGAAVLAGSEVVLSAAIAGDAAIAAESILFEEGASVAGQLTLYVDDPDEVVVPVSVAPADRVEILDAREFEPPRGDFWGAPQPSVFSQLVRFVIGVIVVAAIAVLVALAVPERLAGMRARVQEHPWRSLWSGILGLSTIIGLGVVAALTVIGIPLLPAALLVAVLGGLAGYVLGTYFLGGALWRGLRREDPQTLMHKAALAGLGALAAALVGLIPYVGWLFMLALALTGLGAITTAFRRRAPVSY